MGPGDYENRIRDIGVVVDRVVRVSVFSGQDSSEENNFH